MAIAPLRVRVGTRGGKTTAGGHSAYIDRVDEYTPTPGARQWGRPEVDDVVARGHGNMPAWAITPRMFWDASDKHERENGSTYREHVLTLPRELSRQQQLVLLGEWIQQELGGRHAYQWAFHEPDALDGKKNPHVHLMFSERQVDGLERDPEQYFRRYNSKYPQKGGCRKGYGERAGETLTQVERSGALVRQRLRWEAMVNAALEAARVVDRVSLQSYADRGLDVQREPKLPPGWQRNPSLAEALLAFRAERAAAAAARAELAQAEAELSEAEDEVIAALAAAGIHAPTATPDTAAGGDAAWDQAEVERAVAGAAPIAASDKVALDDATELLEIAPTRKRLMVEAVGVLVLVGRGATTAPTVPVAIPGYRSAIASQAVEYRRDDDEAVAFVDHGDRVSVYVVDRDALRAALLLAANRWDTVRVDGTPEYVRSVRELAGELGVAIEVARDQVDAVAGRDALADLEATVQSPRPVVDREQVEADQDDGRRGAAPIVRREWRSIDPPLPRAGRWQREAAEVLAELAKWREVAERLRSLRERLHRAAEDARRRTGAGDGRDERRVGQLRGLLASLTVALVEGVQQLRTRVGLLVDRLRRLVPPAVDERKDEAVSPAAVAPRKRRPMTLFERLQAEAAERAAALAARAEPLPGNGGDEHEEASPLSGVSPEQQADEVEPRDQVVDGVDDARRALDPDDWSAPGM